VACNKSLHVTGPAVMEFGCALAKLVLTRFCWELRKDHAARTSGGFELTNGSDSCA